MASEVSTPTMCALGHASRKNRVRLPGPQPRSCSKRVIQCQSIHVRLRSMHSLRAHTIAARTRTRSTDWGSVTATACARRSNAGRRRAWPKLMYRVGFHAMVSPLRRTGRSEAWLVTGYRDSRNDAETHPWRSKVRCDCLCLVCSSWFWSPHAACRALYPRYGPHGATLWLKHRSEGA